MNASVTQVRIAPIPVTPAATPNDALSLNRVSKACLARTENGWAYLRVEAFRQVTIFAVREAFYRNFVAVLTKPGEIYKLYPESRTVSTSQTHSVDPNLKDILLRGINPEGIKLLPAEEQLVDLFCINMHREYRMVPHMPARISLEGVLNRDRFPW